MSPFLRQVTTASGATAVQIVSKVRGQRKILEHVGAAHSDQELAALISVGQQKIAARVGTQQQLDLGIDQPEIAVSAGARKHVKSSASRLLVDTIRACYDHLGFSVHVDDEAFFLMVLARTHVQS